jgi:hypothetical protein
MQAMPEGRQTNAHPESILTALLQLNQRQIRLSLDPAGQGAIMGGQAGPPIAADLLGQALAGETMLFPESLDTFAADPEAFADLTSTLPPFAGGNDPLSQVLA